MNFLSHIAGAFADPIAENPTIVMMEAAFRHHQLDWRYVNCRVTQEALSAAVRGACAMNWAGFNCSVPHKVRVVPLLDEISPVAKAIGAVNFVSIQNGELYGDNTDSSGFLESLQSHVEVRGSSMLLLGAGGAARAIVAASGQAGLRSLTLCARNHEQARLVSILARESGINTVSYMPWEATIKPPRDTDILVNSTTIGLYPNNTNLPPLALYLLKRDAVVADVIANPPWTALLQAAKTLGLHVVSGREMLVNQAARSIKLWTSIDVDTSVMRRELDAALGIT